MPQNQSRQPIEEELIVRDDRIWHLAEKPLERWVATDNHGGISAAIT